MKNPLEIPLYVIHRGPVRAITALGLDGKNPASDYLHELKNCNPKGYQILHGQMQFIANSPTLRNYGLFKLLDSSRNLYEFHPRGGLRLYCFLDGESLVVLTNGGKKGNKQNRDIRNAEKLQDAYFAMKESGAKLVFIEKDQS